LTQDVKTGTTTIGLIAENCVVLAADQRASMGHLAIDEDAEKIYKITNNIAVTNAGNVGDSLTIIRFLRSQAKLYELQREEKMTAKALSTFISNILNANRFYPFIVQLVVGGNVHKPELFEITPYGGVVEKKDYAVSGSGTPLAISVLDSQYKKGLSKEEALILAVKAITAGKKRDIYSGGKSITLTIIDSKEVKKLSENEVEKIISMI
jgi:proteasome beta subunit